MTRMTEEYLLSLINHNDAVIRWKANRYLADQPKLQPDIDIHSSPSISNLLIDRNKDGRIAFHPYNKWFGAHWVLSILADLGYPEGDETLKPLLEQCYEWLLSTSHKNNIRSINGRTRRCASQEGNCVYYSLALGIGDERTEELASRLMMWQWEDGGWNCDIRPEAATCSFNETLIPLRGLAWYAKASGDAQAQNAADQAAEVFLKRKLFKRLRDGQVINQNFIKLHYPNYWHYDYLFALKVMVEAGYIGDSRCGEGLDMLESKQLPDGGFPAEERYYRVDDKKLSGHSRVDWGGTSKIKSNPFVSLDAYIVLKNAGRLGL